MNHLSLSSQRTVSALSVGDRVWHLVFDDGGGKHVLLRTLLGRPFVLIVSSAPSAGGSSLFGDAALRGRAAALLVLSAHGCWLRENEDPARYIGLLDGTPGDEPAPQDNDVEHSLTFYVVDLTGMIREIHVEPTGDHRAFAGLRAIRGSLEALSAASSTRTTVLGRREMLIARLVSTLATLALGSPPPPKARAQSGTFRVSQTPPVGKTAARG